MQLAADLQTAAEPQQVSTVAASQEHACALNKRVYPGCIMRTLLWGWHRNALNYSSGARKPLLLQFNGCDCKLYL